MTACNGPSRTVSNFDSANGQGGPGGQRGADPLDPPPALVEAEKRLFSSRHQASAERDLSAAEERAEQTFSEAPIPQANPASASNRPPATTPPTGNTSIKTALSTRSTKQNPSASKAGNTVPATTSTYTPSSSEYQFNPHSDVHRIALALPLTGPLSATGKTIRDGFFSAYYADYGKTHNTQNIEVFDTNNASIASLYQTAAQHHDDIFVGPLTKPEIEKLAALPSFSTPVLALNSPLSKQYARNNLYFFPLSPENEAIEAADLASDLHYKKVVLIAPRNDWGKRMSGAFSHRWQENGSSISAKLDFSPKANLSRQLASFLLLTESQGRIKRLEYLLGMRLHAVPVRRQDMDMIYLIAEPGQARQLKPLLNYYFAEHIPVYAPSNIYSGVPRPNLDHDLDGIQFSDMPWVLVGDQQLNPTLSAMRQKIRKAWPQTYQTFTRFYAFGIDAYRLASHLQSWPEIKRGIGGATGTLYLTDSHQVYRQLVWARMQNGAPKPL